MYEKLLNKALETGADCVGCTASLKYNFDFTVGARFKKGIAGHDLDTGILDCAGRKKLILNGGSVWSKIYKRELIYNYPERFPEGVFFEDNCIMPLIYSRVKQFEFINEPLYYYYQRPNAVTKGLSIDRFENRLNSARTIVKYAKQYNHYDLYKAEIEALFIRIFYINTFISMAQYYPFSIQWFLKFVSMTEEIKKEFPDYLNNPYWGTEFKKKWYIICSVAKKCPVISWGFLVFYFSAQRIWKKIKK